MSTEDKEVTVVVEDTVKKGKAKKEKKISPRKQKKLDKKAAKKEKKFQKKYNKKKKKFDKKYAKASKKYEKKKAKAEKKGKTVKAPAILSREFSYPKKKNYPEKLANDNTRWGKIKRAFYIEKKSHRVLAVIAAVLVVALIVGCSVSSASESRKEIEWATDANNKVDEIVGKINTITIKLGGVPMEEDDLIHIQRQLDRILELLGDGNKSGNADVAAIGQQVEEIGAAVDEAAAQSGTGTGTGTGAAASGAKSGGTAQKGAQQKSAGTKSSGSGVPSTKAEIIDYCNTAVNKVKSQKAGFTKTYIRKIKGSVGSLPSWLTSLADIDEKTTVKKGQDSKDIFPAAGYTWSSKLTENDIKNYTFTKSGNIYKIRLNLVDEDNPKKGESSHYGKCMSVMEQSDVTAMAGAIKSADMHYHNGYLYAEIDSSTGRVIKAEFSATADLKINVTLLGDVSAKDIVSTETFTDFVW